MIDRLTELKTQLRRLLALLCGNFTLFSHNLGVILAYTILDRDIMMFVAVHVVGSLRSWHGVCQNNDYI